MSNTKHTPGKWKIGETKTFDIKGGRTNVLRRIDSDLVIYIAEVYGNDVEAESNAKLIAAAPELLEALNDVYERFSLDNFKNETGFNMYSKIEAAIKKATE